MRIFAADGALLAEFGEERRSFMPIGHIPKVMQDAVLAIEDARFFQHSGDGSIKPRRKEGFDELNLELSNLQIHCVSQLGREMALKAKRIRRRPVRRDQLQDDFSGFVLDELETDDSIERVIVQVQ